MKGTPEQLKALEAYTEDQIKTMQSIFDELAKYADYKTDNPTVFTAAMILACDYDKQYEKALICLYRNSGAMDLPVHRKDAPAFMSDLDRAVWHVSKKLDAIRTQNALDSVVAPSSQADYTADQLACMQSVFDGLATLADWNAYRPDEVNFLDEIYILDFDFSVAVPDEMLLLDLFKTSKAYLIPFHDEAAPTVLNALDQAVERITAMMEAFRNQNELDAMVAPAGDSDSGIAIL